MLPYSYWQDGQRDEAIKAWRLYETNVTVRLGGDKAFWEKHRLSDWRTMWTAYIERIPNVGRREKLLPLIPLGRNREAIDGLEALEKNTHTAVLITLADPVFDPLRREPRFRAILNMEWQSRDQARAKDAVE
jgi:hypothetical protein